MRNQNAKARVARVAGRQFGLVSWAQMITLGIDRAMIHRWVEHGYLHRVLPRVYAVGHRARTTEARLIAALLYAGPGAMLSHATAAWWVGLAASEPDRIHVSTPRRCRSLPGIRIHRERKLERDWHRGLPVTRFPQTMLDYASQATLTNVRMALARADYQGALNAAVIAAVARPGRPGAARLRLALERHLPRLARTRSGIEVALLELCEAHNLPLPEVNVRIAGWLVDAVWCKQRIAVELDAWGNHRTPGQVRRDRRKEMELRAAGFVVLRYSDEQILGQGAEIARELAQLLRDRVPGGDRVPTEERAPTGDRVPGGDRVPTEERAPTSEGVPTGERALTGTRTERMLTRAERRG